MRLVETEKPNFYDKWKKKEGVIMEGVSPTFGTYFDSLPQEYQDMIFITEGMDTGLRKNKTSKHFEGKAIDVRIKDKTNGGREDALYKYMLNDPNREKYGINIIDPDHGTAPHIHLSVSGEEHNHHTHTHTPATPEISIPEVGSMDFRTEFENMFSENQKLMKEKEELENDRKEEIEKQSALRRLQEKTRDFNFLQELVMGLEMEDVNRQK